MVSIMLRGVNQDCVVRNFSRMAHSRKSKRGERGKTMTEKAPPLIELSNIRKSYGGQIVFSQ
jgi:hypothetical protein